MVGGYTPLVKANPSYQTTTKQTQERIASLTKLQPFANQQNSAIEQKLALAKDLNSVSVSTFDATDEIYKLSNKASFDNFSYLVNTRGISFANKTIYMTNDVNFENIEFIPIGTVFSYEKGVVTGDETYVQGKYFEGTFDRLGYEIKNINFKATNKSQSGLFAVINNAVLKNFKASGNATSNYMGLSGVVAISNNSIIFNVINAVNLKSTAEYTSGFMSVVTFNNGDSETAYKTSYIINCTNKASIEGTNIISAFLSHPNGSRWSSYGYDFFEKAYVEILNSTNKGRIYGTGNIVAGFGVYAGDIEPIVSGTPTVLIENADESNITTFSSAYDFVIKSLAFSVARKVERAESLFVFKGSIFIAYEKSKVFIVVPNSVFALSPIIQPKINNFINSDGKLDLTVSIKAGQKVAVGIYSDLINPYNLSEVSVTCFASGSLEIEF